MAEYEAFLQGIKKYIDLNVKYIEVCGDSKVVLK